MSLAWHIKPPPTCILASLTFTLWEFFLFIVTVIERDLHLEHKTLKHNQGLILVVTTCMEFYANQMDGIYEWSLPADWRWRVIDGHRQHYLCCLCPFIPCLHQRLFIWVLYLTPRCKIFKIPQTEVDSDTLSQPCSLRHPDLCSR